MFEREELIQAMQEYGLNEKAALIYLVTLQIGNASAATIARLSQIKRVTTYAILQDLIRGGYIRELTKGGVKHFSAVPPEHLLTIKKQQYARFEALLPAFSTLMNEYTNRPKVEYFEGFSGLKEYYDRHLESSTDIFSFLSVTHVRDDLYQYLHDVHVPERVKRNIFARVIMPKTEENMSKYIGFNKEGLRETVVIDNPVFQTGSGIDLFNENQVGFAMFSGEEMSATIIESPKLYMSLKSIFDLLWETYHGK